MPGSKSDERIIIIAPVGSDATAMAELLAQHGFKSEICDGPNAACRQLITGSGALLLTEEALDLPEMPELLSHLNQQPAWSELPIIILAGRGEPRLARLLDRMASAAGSITVLERPIEADTLVRSVQVALRSRRRQYEARDL